MLQVTAGFNIYLTFGKWKGHSHRRKRLTTHCGHKCEGRYVLIFKPQLPLHFRPEC